MSEGCRQNGKTFTESKQPCFASAVPWGKIKEKQTCWLRACLHGGGGPQIGEVTCGGSPHLSCKRDQIKMRGYMDRRVTPPKRVTLPTWGLPPPCKQALRGLHRSSLVESIVFCLFLKCPSQDFIKSKNDSIKLEVLGLIVFAEF